MNADDYPIKGICGPSPAYKIKKIKSRSQHEIRKSMPVATGLLDYFPDACLAVSHCSWVGNEQHSPGKPMRWVRDKSYDHADALMRHFIKRGEWDESGIERVRHMTKVAWRAFAMLQLEIEQCEADSNDE